MTAPTIKQILNLVGLEESDIIAIYPYGSRVYGTNTFHSDYDYLLVYQGTKGQDGQQYDSHDGKLSVHTYSAEAWQQHLNDHKIFAMEAFCTMDVPPFTFTLDKALLRKEISAKASNSWVKCKKKLEVADEYYIGIKSLFHSFRIPMFGIQIATHGRITDFSVANKLWKDELEVVLLHRPTWEDLKREYQPRHNALMTEFRKLAEKV